jgi:hypothetical protein
MKRGGVRAGFWPPEDWDTWLDPMQSTDEVLLPLLKPFAPDLMQP